MKDGIKEIVGKTIAAVVVASNNRKPYYQIFLVFDDETSFEIFGDAMTCASGLNPWGIDRVFDPHWSRDRREDGYRGWKRAVERAKGWLRD